MHPITGKNKALRRCKGRTAVLRFLRILRFWRKCFCQSDYNFNGKFVWKDSKGLSLGIRVKTIKWELGYSLLILICHFARNQCKRKGEKGFVC